MEVIYYTRKHHQFVELNSNIHTYNTQRKMDIHIQSYITDLYKRIVLNMGSKLYNKLPGYINEINSYKQGRHLRVASATTAPGPALQAY